MFPHSSLEESEGWLQQHCFIHEPHQDSYVAFKHAAHQCSVLIEDCLTFRGTVMILVKCITAIEIHCWYVRHLWFDLQGSPAPPQRHENGDSWHLTANEKIDQMCW